MELRDYLRVLRTRWMVIVAGVLVVVAAAAALTFTTTPQYASTARLYVSSAQSNSAMALQSGQLSAQRIASYANLVQSRELAQAVIDDLGLPMRPGELAGKVSAEVIPSTVLLQIRVVDPDPAQAQALAQGYAQGMSDMIRELETPAGKTVPPIKATIVDAASRPVAPFSPQPVRNLGAGLLLGLLFGLGLALLRDTLDTSVSTAEDFAHATDAPLLGSIAYDTAAKAKPLVTSLESHAPRVESFRVLRTNFQFVDVDSESRVFVITSAIPQEGKTTTAVNLAITLAQAGQRTLLIECDLRRPHAARSLGMDNAVGVTTVLVGKVSVDDAIQKHPSSDLHFLGSGAIPPNPAELIQSRAMAELLTRVRGQYDTVVIDAPPLLPVTDAALLATQADGAVLVTRFGKTTKDQVAQAVDRLVQVDAKLVGAVLNMVPTGRRRYGYGYAPVAPDTKKKSRRGRSPRNSS